MPAARVGDRAIGRATCAQNRRPYLGRRRAIFQSPQPRAGWLAAVLSMYPRAPRISLTATGLDMPAVDHLSNNVPSTFFSIEPSQDFRLGCHEIGRWLPCSLTSRGSPTRLSAKRRCSGKVAALRRAPRWSLDEYYLRALDHLENCVSATHRAVLNARALQANGICRAGLQLTRLPGKFRVIGWRFNLKRIQPKEKRPPSRS
jgi:hypothetical protein